MAESDGYKPTLQVGRGGGNKDELYANQSDLKFEYNPPSTNPFPLTPTLSPGERETPNPALGTKRGCGWSKDWKTILPLPKGEGRGEGEANVFLGNVSSIGCENLRDHFPTSTKSESNTIETAPWRAFTKVMKKFILSPAFTLLELLTVISIVSVLAGLLLPSLSRGKQQARRVVCLNNVYQLGLTWRLYADDHQGQCVANGLALIDGNITDEFGVTSNKSWCQGAMVNKFMRTNTAMLFDSNYALFADYLQASKVYRCPGDPSVNVRSYQLNFAVGRQNYSSFDFLVFGSDRLIYKPMTAMPECPANTFLFMDSFYKSICWPFFSYYSSLESIATYPANYHGGSAVSFADGHAERRVWRDGRTYKTEDSNAYHNHLDTSPGNEDVKWISSHGLEKE